MDYSIYDAAFHTGAARPASKRERRLAVKSFSTSSFSLVLFSVISSVVIVGVEIALLLFCPHELLAEILESPYFLWGMQILGPYAVAFPILLLMTKDLPRARYKSSKMGAGEFITVFVISSGVMVFGSIVSNVILGVIEYFTGSPIPDVSSEMILNSPTWLVLLVVVVIGPIVEEIIFRKVFIDRMSLYGDRLAIAVSSVLFGLFHGNIAQLVYATALGVILGYVYTRTRKIKYSIILHMLINFFGTMPSIIMLDCADTIDKITLKYPDGVLPEDAIADSIEIFKASITVLSLTAIQYGLAIAGIIVFIVLTAKGAYKIPKNCEIKLPKRTVLRAVFFNAGTLLFVLFSVLTVLLSITPDIISLLTDGAYSVY